MKRLSFSIIAIALVGCMHRLVMDPSLPALQAGDYTLASAACEAMPGRGADICRVKEGSPIQSTWKLVLPSDPKILGGEIAVTYRDTTRQYAITGPTVEIPFQDLLGHALWQKDDRGSAVALATIRYQGNEAEAVWRARGLAIIVVTDADYDPMPIDSGFVGLKTKCEIQYSTAGRSAIKCSK